MGSGAFAYQASALLWFVVISSWSIITKKVNFGIYPLTGNLNHTNSRKGPGSSANNSIFPFSFFMSTKTIPSSQPQTTDLEKPLYTPIKRRSFFMYAGATAGATALVLAGCKKDDSTTPTPAAGTVSLGNGNLSVLQYAYSLEQLEAAFYAQVVKTPASDFAPIELAYFTQVATHEAIHRDFFKAAITNVAKGTPIMDLTPDFSSIDFTKRAGVLGAAKAFEDLGVSAYNGAGKLISNSDANGAAYLTLAGKIVSVEARHAAYVRDLLNPGSFAADDQVDPASGLDMSMTPVAVITAAQKYVKQTIDASQVGK